MNERVFYDHPAPVHHLTETWCDHRRWPRLDSGLRYWLLDDGSLTRRLIEASGGRFAVRPYRQGWLHATVSERRALRLGNRRHVFVRETVLTCAGEPWVFARTAIPPATLRGRNRRLTRLGTRSLGSWLFADRGLRRDAFEIARLAPGNATVPATLQDDATLWGRRSRFVLRGRPLLVAEIFLPHFRPWPATALHVGGGRPVPPPP